MSLIYLKSKQILHLQTPVEDRTVFNYLYPVNVFHILDPMRNLMKCQLHCFFNLKILELGIAIEVCVSE